MAAISVAGVSRWFGTHCALDNVTIDFPDGGFYALLGPSGSGKTTLLRVIAGFDSPDEGTITVDGESVEQIPVEKRNVGLMFQHYALFPHMSVFDNIAFALTVRRTNRSEIRTRVHEVLELVRLQGLEARKPDELSGGQKQRVALARAIVFRPRVLLLDEPLSALDKSLRLDMQVELKRIQREIGITTLMVTHDQEEALSLSDRIGILNHGALIQQGTPLELYEQPVSPFAATFLGDANLFTGQRSCDVAGTGTESETSSRSASEIGSETSSRIAFGRSRVDLDIGYQIECESSHMPDHEDIVCAVRPEKMHLLNIDDPVSAAMNTLEATVVRHQFAGSSLSYELVCEDAMLRVFVQNHGAPLLAEGVRVRVAWDPSHTIVMRQQAV